MFKTPTYPNILSIFWFTNIKEMLVLELMLKTVKL